MSYDAEEVSVEDGSPNEVYEITIGAQSLFYTSGEDDVTLGPTTYTAVAGLKRGKEEEGDEARDRDFSLEMPSTDPLAAYFKPNQLPGVRIEVKASRYHRGDTPTPEVVVFFEGCIVSARFKEDAKVCALTARPTLGAVSRLVPRRMYKAGCNNVLYDPVTCKVDDTDPAFRASAISVVGQMNDMLTVTGLTPTYADGWFDAGYVESLGTSDFRLVTSHTGNMLTLLVGFPTDSIPSSVNVFAGCDHTLEGGSGCGAKFDNVLNYAGFAWVPSKPSAASRIR